MKKLIFKVLLFLSIIVCALFVLSTFSKVPSHFQNTMNNFEEIVDENKTIDIAIYGSSHAYCSYDPLILDSITQTRSFNFGNDSQRLLTTNFVIKETLKKIRPKLVIVDFYSATMKMPITEENLFFQKRTYDHFPMSSEKIKYLSKLNQNLSISATLFPILDRRDFAIDWIDGSDFNYPSRANAFQYKGFVGFNLRLHKSAMKKTEFYINNSPWKKAINTKMYDKFLNVDEKENIFDMVRHLKSLDATILFTVAPYFGALVDPNYLSLNKFYQNVADEMGIELIDFNVLIQELAIGAEDFKDAQHLNTEGAQKVSNYLGKYIRKNYELPSRKNDVTWINEQPKSLENHIISDFQKKSISVNEVLFENIKIKSIGFYRERTSKQCILQLENIVDDSIINMYKLGFHTYPFDRDKKRLTGYAKAKNRDFDAWDFKPKLTNIKGKTYIIKRITTSINEFKKIKLFLYDRNGYKEIIGNSIETKEIHLK